MDIIDNFLDKDTFIKFAGGVMQLPWFYSPTKTTALGHSETWNQQMSHSFYYNGKAESEHTHLLKPFNDFFMPNKYLRVKANLTMPTSKIHAFDMHNDCGNDMPYKTAIFYLNNNDGKTVFEANEEIESIENRLVIFDGRITHAGTTHTNKKFRCVINFNWT